MKQIIGFFCVLLTTCFSLLHSESCFASTCSRAQSSMQSYQNYNHGYIPTCENCQQNPCECNQCAAENACTPSNPAACAPPCGQPPVPNGHPPASCITPGINPPPPPPPGAPCAQAPCDQAPCAKPGCDPCDPCAPVCGTECGISICAIGIAIAAVIAAAVIIVSSGNGSSSHSQ